MGLTNAPNLLQWVQRKLRRSPKNKGHRVGRALCFLFPNRPNSELHVTEFHGLGEALERIAGRNEFLAHEPIVVDVQ